jgi:hypothetical protein
MIVVAEVHEVAFQKRRPTPREHPFNATTSRPACSGSACVAKIKSSEGEVCFRMSPGHAALTVEQPAGCKRIAEATRQGVEPISLEVNRATCEWADEDCSIPMKACLPSNILRMPMTHPPVN